MSGTVQTGSLEAYTAFVRERHMKMEKDIAEINSPYSQTAGRLEKLRKTRIEAVILEYKIDIETELLEHPFGDTPDESFDSEGREAA